MEMETDVRYSEQAEIFLRQASEELGKGDLRQAAEKGWGAASQMIKAAAEQRGWRHNGHYHLAAVASRLTEETDDIEIADCFSAAQSLHTYFYEGGLTRFVVSSYLTKVDTLVRKLSILNGQP